MLPNQTKPTLGLVSRSYVKHTCNLTESNPCKGFHIDLINPSIGVGNGGGGGGVGAGGHCAPNPQNFADVRILANSGKIQESSGKIWANSCKFLANSGFFFFLLVNYFCRDNLCDHVPLIPLLQISGAVGKKVPPPPPPTGSVRFSALAWIQDSGKTDQNCVCPPKKWTGPVRLWIQEICNIKLDSSVTLA